ncbi:UNKNOWN [Stylonychia lemnae]|uniref:Leucine rich repeat family protein n=1 Tax=Stylonychia lemnae TaxID=5949 RepID=A0A078AB90_STYLE|nr:UNKNOWN [Stylonychia lemnae]|eukprot:CDW79560.1 UNKNOWN [Stylonychia lemnae]
MGNFFNTRGPIRPQNLVTNMDPAQAQRSNSNNVRIPQARDFIRNDQNLLGQAQLNQQQLNPNQQQMLIEMLRNSGELQRDQDFEYGIEEDDQSYGGEDEEQDGGHRIQYTYQEQMQILVELQKEGQRNPEFLKVLDILQKDDELRPLIFEHDILLRALRDMDNIKAEIMLSILTAAETEMYENSRQRDELQATNTQYRNHKPETKEVAIAPIQSLAITQDNSQAISDMMEQSQKAKDEIQKLRHELAQLEHQNMDLTQELKQEKELRINQEREQECTFKNLYEENQQLKKLNETLKKNETETKIALESRERQHKEEIEQIKSKLKQQEDMRLSILENKSKVELDLQKNEQLIERLHKEIQLMEKDNEAVHRKLNSTLNSVLFQSQLNHNFLNNLNKVDTNINLGEHTPARRNLSTSFQHSGMLDQNLKKDSLIGQPAFGYGQSTQKLKLLMSENNKSQGTQSFIAHSIYYGLGQLGGNQNNNHIYFQRGDSLVRSNSIEVILLEDEEHKKQNMFPMGEEEKQNSVASGVLTNKQSWLKTKGLFNDLSPINSISSHQMDHSTSRQNQQRMRRLQEVEEEQTEILGTNPGTATYAHPVKYYEDQIKRMQSDIERYKDEIKELTTKLHNTNNFILKQTDESPFHDTDERQKIFATPQNNNSNYKSNYPSAFGETGAHEETKYQRQIQLTNNHNPMYTNEQSPMMATFSNQKDRHFYSQYNVDNNQHFQSQQSSSVPKTSEQERNQIMKEVMQKLENDFQSKLTDIRTKLISLFKKFFPTQEELIQFNTEDINVSLLNKIITEIMIKVDQCLDLQHSRQPSSAVMSQGHQPFIYFPNSQSNIPFNHYGPGSYGGQWAHHGLGSHINSTTMEQTPFELKNLFLEEKEKRLLVVEELQKTNENFMRYKNENERLKQELQAEKQQNQSMQMSYVEQNTFNNDLLLRNLKNAEKRLELVSDENTTLKLRIGELESELYDERSGKAHKAEYTIQHMQSTIQGQFYDQKIKFEEQIFTLKQEVHKATLELQVQFERNQELRESVQLLKERNQELEGENYQSFKEHYKLQSDLDYETLRASQLTNTRVNQRDKLLSTFNKERSKLEDQLAKFEQRNKELQYLVNEYELKVKKVEDMNILTKLSFEDEIRKLQIDNRRLLDQIQSLQDQNKQLREYNIILKNEKQQAEQIPQQDRKINDNTIQLTRQMASLKMSNILKRGDSRKITKAFIKFIENKHLHQFLENSKINQSQMSLNMLNEPQNAKILELQERQQILDQQNTNLVKLASKMLRQANLRRPIKANFQGLVSSQTVNYIIYGLKNNTEIYELNLSSCELDDNDLIRLVEMLKFDQGLQNLKLSSNRFAQIQPLLELVQTKAHQFKILDISYCQINEKILELLPKTIIQLVNLKELYISGIINQQLAQSKDKVNNFLQAIVTLRTLNALDLSKNKLLPDSIITFCNNMKLLSNLNSLALSSIQMIDECSQAVQYMITALPNLRKLLIQGNSHISAKEFEGILRAIKKEGFIEELDLSQCQVGSSQCIQILLEILITNKNITTLGLKKVQLKDTMACHLIQGIVNSLNLQVLKLDQNLITHIFVEKLTENMIINKLSNKDLERQRSRGYQSNHSLLNQDSDGSFLALSEENSHSSQHKSANQGLQQISLSLNKIGDKGAIAISKLIRIPNDHTRLLKAVCLDECGITQIGFQALRDALQERGNMTTQFNNLSHVKISIDRNNIE